MNSKTAKCLRTIANALPILNDKKGVQRTGKELLAAGYENSEDGDAINVDQLYTIYVPKNINHYDQIKLAYKAGGMEAVNTYAANVKQAHKELLQHRALKRKHAAAAPTEFI